MEKINDGGPAFPLGANEYGGHGSCFGMTLRDYFAAKAMQSLRDDVTPFRMVAEQAYEMADAMLSARGARHD